MDEHVRTWLGVQSASEKEKLGHQFLEVTYVTIQGTGGSIRMWSYELVNWLASKPGVLIVKLWSL